jgi:parallel beta-helix repeat protein
MKRKTVSAITLILLLASMSTLAFNIQPVKAGGTIYIRADGSVDPPTAPIQQDERIYTFTGNINDSIVVQRSNIIIDGAGCALQGPGSGNGFYLSGINNVTIKGTNVKGFDWGIGLSAGASYNTILGNNITSNYGGVHLSWSSGNVLKNNSMINNDYNFMVVGYALSHFVQDIDTSNTVDGKPIYYWVSRENIEVPSDAGYVALVNSTNITVKGLRLKNNGQAILLAYTTNAQIVNNNLTNNYYGISLLYSSNNNIYRNDITNNSWCGVWLECSSDNRLCHNNFISNQYHVYFSVGPSINTWDDGYPSGGNYWSDYTGIDAYSGPYQNETERDGIGDVPYVIDADNRDNYPLMPPYVPVLGDLNQDGIVNVLDAIQAASAFGSYPGHPKWNEQADINRDGVVNILDVIILANNFGKHSF